MSYRNTVALVSVFQLRKSGHSHHRALMTTVSKRGFRRSYIGADSVPHEQTWRELVRDVVTSDSLKGTKYFGILLVKDERNKGISNVDRMASGSTVEKFDSSDKMEKWISDLEAFNAASAHDSTSGSVEYAAIFNRDSSDFPNAKKEIGTLLTTRELHEVPENSIKNTPPMNLVEVPVSKLPKSKDEGINPAVAGILVGLGGITLASIFGKK